MATEIKVPTLGESVTEATVAKWFKAEGDAVAVDEPILELETDKVTVEVNATAAGMLSEITAKEGDNVEVGALLGMIGEGGSASAKKAEPAEEPAAENAPAALCIGACEGAGRNGRAAGVEGHPCRESRDDAAGVQDGEEGDGAREASGDDKGEEKSGNEEGGRGHTGNDEVGQDYDYFSGRVQV